MAAHDDIGVFSTARTILFRHHLSENLYGMCVGICVCVYCEVVKKIIDLTFRLFTENVAAQILLNECFSRCVQMGVTPKQVHPNWCLPILV